MLNRFSDGIVVMAFDFGTRRIGVALGNTLTKSVRPLKTIDGSTNDAKWTAITRLIDEWKPLVAVVGLPRHPDGQPNEMTPKAQRFANQLTGRYNLMVKHVDERYTSAVIENENPNADIDAESAALILQQWFDEGAC